MIGGRIEVGIPGIEDHFIYRISTTFFDIHCSPSWHISFALNLEKPYFQNLDFRRDLNYAVNSILNLDPDNYYTFDPERVVEYLRPLEIPKRIRICHDAFSYSRRVGAALAIMLEHIGIGIKRSEYKPSVFLEKATSGECDIYPLIWATYSGSDYWWLKALKIFGFDDALLDLLIERIEREKDENVRKALTEAAKEIAYADAPWVFAAKDLNFCAIFLEGKIDLKKPGILKLGSSGVKGE